MLGHIDVNLIFAHIGNLHNTFVIISIQNSSLPLALPIKNQSSLVSSRSKMILNNTPVWNATIFDDTLLWTILVLSSKFSIITIRMEIIGSVLLPWQSMKCCNRKQTLKKAHIVFLHILMIIILTIFENSRFVFESIELQAIDFWRIWGLVIRCR